MPEASESASASTPVVAGDVVAGKYEILKPLGSGGMGFVFQATHKALGQKVAIKFLSASSQDAAASERFAREAHISAELTAEQVARVIDLGSMADGTAYIVMEFLEGQDFDALLEAQGPLPFADAVDHILQACVAIAEAHALGIVHRDIKPGNLFLTRRADGSPLVKVLDFGISKRIAGADTRLTQTGSSFGSPLYMSPEQLRDSKNVDTRSDIWALGMVLYELIAGVAAFESETLHETVSKIAADEPASLRSLVRDVPEGLDAVVARCLEKKREDRPQNVADLARALAPFASESVVAMYLGRVCGSLERIPVTPSSPRLPVAASSSSSPIGSRTQRAWHTTMRPASARTRRAAMIVAAVVLSVGAAAAMTFFVMRQHGKPSPALVATESASSPRLPDPVDPIPFSIGLPAVTVAPAPARATASGAPDAGPADRPGQPVAHPHPPASAPPPAARKGGPRTPSVNDDPFKTR